MSTWAFLTNHACVLLCVAQDPDTRIRDIAAAVGITERAAQRIVNDLVAAGYLSRRREGRRSRYDVHSERPLRRPSHEHHQVGILLALLTGSALPATQRGGAAA